MRLPCLLFALLLLGLVYDIIDAQGLRKRRQATCSTATTSGSLSPLYLLTAGEHGTASYHHVLTTVNSASDWTYNSTLAATALTAVPSDCPSSCLQLLTLYQITAQPLFGIGSTKIDYVDAFNDGDESFLKLQGYSQIAR
uniref:Uncharacterized protein n=1 Tax=Plectus sambesii TaxID=2011161 RepID=A0A914WUY9_9BILA